MRARSVWLAGITAVGVLLAGCADEEAPASLPEVRSPSAELEGASPRISAAAPLPSDLEAEIRTLYGKFADLSNLSYSSRDALEQRRALYADSCVSCSAGHEIADTVLDNGYTFEGDPVTVESVIIDSVEGDLVTFRVVIDSPAAKVIDQQGATIEEFQGFENLTTLYAARRQESGEWMIVSDRVLGTEQ
jgi:hypothetical protein